MTTEHFHHDGQFFAYEPERPAQPTATAATPQNRNGLTVTCDYGRDGKPQRKIERLAGKTDEYAYAFDRNGRLAEVR